MFITCLGFKITFQHRVSEHYFTDFQGGGLSLVPQTLGMIGSKMEKSADEQTLSEEIFENCGKDLYQVLWGIYLCHR